MTDQDRLALDIATRWYRHPGSREKAIRDELNLTPTRFWQRAWELLSDPEAILAEPAKVNQLQRMTARRDGVRQRRAS